MKTILLLIASNTFMTVAWYGHLRYTKFPLLTVMAIIWLIALPEYLLQVPANRIGHEHYEWSATQLKVIQEVISLSVFAMFAFFYFREVPGWRQALAFVLIVGASFLILPDAFSKKPDPAPKTVTTAPEPESTATE
jgi:uncharacterized protein (DUF486 family)